MLILIFGKDQYRAKEKLKEILRKENKLTQKSQLSDLISEDMTFEELEEQLRQSPMFPEKKLFVLRNALAQESFCEKVLENKKIFFGEERNTIIFFEEKEISKPAKTINFFKKYGTVFEFSPLTSSETRKWIKERIGFLGVVFDAAAINALEVFVGNDLWRMSAEIEKLAAYKPEGPLNKKDVELLVSPRIETAIFKTIDAMAEKNKKRALSLVQGHLEGGDSPFYLFSMVVFQFRNLLIVKEMEDMPLEEIIRLAKPMHPFVVKKSRQQAGKFTLKQLKEIYFKIFKVDLAVKTGKMKPEMALELLIADI